jgi:F-type H+-transporting ATPase subunit b
MGTFGYLVMLQVALFVVIVFIIRRIVLRDTMKAVARMRETESELARKEEAVRKRIEDNEAEFKQKSAEAQEALARSRDHMEKEMAKTREALLGDAKKEKDKILDEANRSRDKIRQELIREAERKTLEHATRVYEMVFSEDLGRKLDQAFLDELLSALEEMDASSITVAATAVEVECAHGLDEARRQQIAALVARKFDVNLPLKESIAPELIAGVKLKLGSLEIDGSLLNRFREAAEELKKANA